MHDILIDTSIFQHAAAIKGEWQSTGTKLWGGVHPIDTGYLATIDKPIPIRDSVGGPQSLFIAALAQNFRDDSQTAHTTDALRFEKLHQPSYTPSYGDISLMKGVPIKSHKTLSSFSFTLPIHNPIVELRTYLSTQTDAVFLSILDTLGGIGRRSKNSQDAWHICSAINLGMDYFLTCDTKLIGQIRSIGNKEIRAELLSKVKLPSSLCNELKIEPWSKRDVQNFAQENGSFPFATK